MLIPDEEYMDLMCESVKRIGQYERPSFAQKWGPILPYVAFFVAFFAAVITACVI